MKELNYKISAIFYSIQGEGYFTGEAGIFLRFYSCDLACPFCDDSAHKDSFVSLSSKEIIEKISAFPAKKLFITGGEPTLYELNSLIKELKSVGFFVCVETNGLNLQKVKEANWITYCPKDMKRLLKSGFDEIKFLIDEDTDINKVLEFETDKPKFLQPINHFDSINEKNMTKCIEIVLANPSFKLSTQMHKLLGIE